MSGGQKEKCNAQVDAVKRSIKKLRAIKGTFL
jgi:hypothetical protein